MAPTTRAQSRGVDAKHLHTSTSSSTDWKPGSASRQAAVGSAMKSKKRKSRALEDAADHPDRKRNKASAKSAKLAPFGYDLPYDRLDLRKHPHLYRPGRAGSEQGVFHCQPYKGELLPHWAFKNPRTASESARALEAAFRRYVDAGDFVGADCARKFIQMGFTRSRRYANHAGGRKYAQGGSDRGKNGAKTELTRGPEDPVKAESARIFMASLTRIKADEEYLRLQTDFQEKYAGVPLPSTEEVEKWTTRGPDADEE